ncbi:MAG: AAA domain-containing protein [Candidatus Latescibacteria bacterium]|nr:AAA domain-containing protein [Candidatus Latescibacterota bacterium]
MTISPEVSKATERLKSLRDYLKNDVFVGKDEVIDLLIVCLVAREPMLLVGPPGTAKSDIIVALCQGLGLRSQADAGDTASRDYFEYLLTQYTEPNEIFGPVDIKALQDEGNFRRKGHGMLQDVFIAFLDEVFKANSAILNALLTIMNERRYYESGRYMPIKLITLFGATNRIPASSDLDALYDRFTLRVESRNVAGDLQNQLIERAWNLEIKKSKDMHYLEPQASLSDIQCVNKALLETFDTDAIKRLSFLDVFLRKIRAIRDDQICRINDRKMIKIVKLMMANALLEGREPSHEDMYLLDYIWDDPENMNQRERLHEIAYR